MAKLNNVEIHFKHSNRTYNAMTAFLVMYNAMDCGTSHIIIRICAIINAILHSVINDTVNHIKKSCKLCHLITAVS